MYTPRTPGFSMSPALVTNLVSRMKKDNGGKWPRIEGRKYKYPLPSNDTAWRSLVHDGILYSAERSYCLLNGFRPPYDKARHGMLLYTGRGLFTPYEKKRRAKRGKDRAHLGIKKGSPLQVHHMNGKSLSFNSTVALTHCQHLRAHGRRCITPKYVAGKHRAYVKAKNELKDSYERTPRSEWDLTSAKRASARKENTKRVRRNSKKPSKKKNPVLKVGHTRKSSSKKTRKK